MGLSDHAEFIATLMFFNEWDTMQVAADQYNEPGRFVALRGFEYSSPITGHMCVFNTDDFASALRYWTHGMFLGWLSKRPEAVATYNHPGSYDIFDNEFRHFLYHAAADQQIMGIENITHGNDYDAYWYGYGGTLPYLDEANREGWHVGTFFAQDNHSGDWGIADDYRTGIWAAELTRDALIRAMKARRFFTTEDVNAQMMMTADGFPMGAHLRGGEKEFVIYVLDEDQDDSYSLVEFYRDGELYDDFEVSGSYVELSVTVPSEPEPHYYVAFAHQEDGDRSMTAPIWIKAD